MTDKPVLQPGPDHPITVTPNHNRVIVTVAGKVVADTRNALTLQESTYPPVQYVPLADVDQSLLERSSYESYCPFKGDATYYSIPLGGDKSKDAVWEYNEPYEAVAAIKGHVAFWDGRVDSVDVEAEGQRA
ncbi:DUF427 domain-containing protein [Cryptosporangium sp. NPDC048952]|uniref:DUF427 domain-containing protein n=1 Tax=Cryptosporangium sp. NPDC048952 TaxID=3363961 RepID=UPI00371CCE83